MKKHLTKSDYIEMPWANGLGMTMELAIREHANPKRRKSPFIWRISIAGVTEDGAFSHFPHIERHIMLLDGNGIILDGGEDEGVHHLDQPNRVYSFPGDADIYGKLIEGPITDFNVMVDWRVAEAKVDVLEVSKLQEFELNGDVQFIHVLETSSPVHLRFDRENISLKSGESFLTQGISETVELQTEFGEFATVFIITIDLL